MSRKTQLLQTACMIIFVITSFNATAQVKMFVEGFTSKPFIYNPRTVNNFPGSGNRSPYRTYDGTNNNISFRKTNWGATDIPLFRELPAEFGPADRNNAMGGTTRPSARQISNAVCDEPVTTFNDRGLSTFIYVWGQFIDHDMSLTPTGTTEYVPIALPADEKIFNIEIPFNRSQVYPGTGIRTPRDQINLNTAWIDGSQVYGTDSVRTRWMRTFKSGKMKISAGNFLPYNTLTGELSGPIDVNAPGMANDSNHTVKTFVAGDIRAAEHPGIIAMHTLFVREHNKICDRLMAEGVKGDEEIFQRARKEIGAIIESITYEEFLPAMGVILKPYSGYRPDVRPDIMNTFATGAYRVGHTMVADDILLRDINCAEVAPGELDLLDVFWTPQIVIQYGLEPFLKGFAGHTQYETDTKINSVLRNFLFVSPNDPVRFGIDLASLNIQRGRDHGLPNYNTIRKYYTGSGAKDFSQVTSNANLADSLKKLYGTVNNMDLWVGVLAEDHLPGKSIGNTMHRMLKAQFENLRDGDFYFYKNDPFLPTASRIRAGKTKLSDIIKRNSKITNIQSNVFFTLECAIDDSTTAGKSDTTGTGGTTVTPHDTTSVKLFPNPSTGLVTLDLGPGGQSLSFINIYNANGILVKTIQVGPKQLNIQVDMSCYQNGVYYITYKNNKEVRSVKLIKVSN